jgi:hypothetical protein
MKRFLAALLAVIGTLAGSQLSPGLARDLLNQTSVVHTNFVDRWITNTAQVQMQVNRFVTEYHTNWVTRAHTNVVDVFSTNIFFAFHTNRVQQVRTNLAEVFTTNLVARTITNHYVLDKFETNFVQTYHTNFKTLNLTNWTSIVALKTNWITKPMTNVVEIDVAADAVPVVAPAPHAPVLSEPLALRASRNPRRTPNNQFEVELKVSWTQTPTAPLQVQQWRIESQDGSILCFGQDLEFKRALPTGTYKVLVRAQRDLKSPMLAALGTLTVTPREVLLEQRPARTNSST